MKFKSFLRNRTVLDNGHSALSPAVSIVMPTYSRMAEGFLARCIDSVLAQTYRDFEFVIIDDGSFDGSQGLITDRAKKDPRIVYVRHDDNSGLPAVRTNEGIMLARGAYVAFIFDDNIWEPESLSIMMENMLGSPVDVLHANTRMIQAADNDFDLGGWPLTIELLQHLNTIPNGAVLCRRSFFERYGMYDPHLSVRRICDWDLWLRGLRLGATFRHMNVCLGIELGPSSPVSLGNSVKMDYKVVFPYMTDESQIARRSESLRPEDILEYDVFEPLRVFPYIRDENEWKSFQANVYAPFFDSHRNFREALPIVHNNMYDRKGGAACINTNDALFKDKKRALIVCNRFTPFVEDWKDSFESSLGVIAITCSEWQASAFSPKELDYLILIDCAALFLKPFVQDCREHEVAIGYVVMHGKDVAAPENNPLKRLEFTSHDSIWKTFKTDIYFPHFGVPWSGDETVGAKALMGLAHKVFEAGREAGEIAILPGVRGVGLPYLARRHPAARLTPAGASFDKVPLAFYLGAPAEYPAAVRADLCAAATSLAVHFEVKLLVLKDSELPEEFARCQSLQDRLIFSDESLLTWARHLKSPCAVVVPDPVLDQMNAYFVRFLEDDLARSGAALFRLSELAGRDKGPDSAAWVAAALRSKLDRIAERQAGMREGCRLTQFACAANSLLLQRGLDSLQPRAVAQRIAVLLNSPLLSGSEAYGLLLVKAMAKLGFEVITLVPKMHGYGEVAPTDINGWLQGNGLAPVTELSFGLGTRCFHLPAEDCMAHSRGFNEWLDQQGVKLVLCSGFIPDPLIVHSSSRRPVFMALFQPWGYPLEKMAFLRERVAGIMSDSEWSASYWARFLPPPIGVVPTGLSAQRFNRINGELGSGTICIAIGGTLQPRKRQREAIDAVRSLVAEGHDIRLNIYGYELAVVSEYVRELRELVDSAGLGEIVRFHGLVQMDDIARDNHVILSASIDESLPQTLLFAMAAGLVAVACPAGGIGEIVIDGETGYLGAGFSVADIREALKRAIGKRDEWTDIQARAVDHLSRRHGELNVSKQLLRMLLEGLEIERSPGRRLFPPLTGPQGEIAVAPPPSPLLQPARTGGLKRKIYAHAKATVGPHLSPGIKSRLRLVLHRLGLF